MLAAALQSPRAVQVSIEVVRAFADCGQLPAGNVELARKLAGAREEVWVCSSREPLQPALVPDIRTSGWSRTARLPCVRAVQRFLHRGNRSRTDTCLPVFDTGGRRQPSRTRARRRSRRRSYNRRQCRRLHWRRTRRSCHCRNQRRCDTPSSISQNLSGRAARAPGVHRPCDCRRRRAAAIHTTN